MELTSPLPVSSSYICGHSDWSKSRASLSAFLGLGSFGSALRRERFHDLFFFIKSNYLQLRNSTSLHPGVPSTSMQWGFQPHVSYLKTVFGSSEPWQHPFSALKWKGSRPDRVSKIFYGPLHVMGCNLYYFAVVTMGMMIWEIATENTNIIQSQGALVLFINVMQAYHIHSSRAGSP